VNVNRATNAVLERSAHRLRTVERANIGPSSPTGFSPEAVVEKQAYDRLSEGFRAITAKASGAVVKGQTLGPDRGSDAWSGTSHQFQQLDPNAPCHVERDDGNS
jgi:hypothetical protein